ncbi:hypothetical protein BDZ91DRAFT_766270 [Kalaharituber pfeilii]|nr:hypothetical protein BDZ91DRAFT_766270 [Kalaharituber pfeilii]
MSSLNGTSNWQPPGGRGKEASGPFSMRVAWIPVLADTCWCPKIAWASTEGDMCELEQDMEGEGGRGGGGEGGRGGGEGSRSREAGQAASIYHEELWDGEWGRYVQRGRKRRQHGGVLHRCTWSDWGGRLGLRVVWLGTARLGRTRNSAALRLGAGAAALAVTVTQCCSASPLRGGRVV